MSWLRILTLCLLWSPAITNGSDGVPSTQPAARKKVAAVVTSYFHNSHADVIVSRLLQTDTLDGKGRHYDLELESLYMDQIHPKDIGGALAAEHGVPVYDNIADALTLGGDKLAVDGVLLVAEHGDYPKNPYGNTQYPKRRFWDETIAVFKKSGRVAPVFIDKHLADNWEDAKHIYDTAREMNIPIMAGSSQPLKWRRPPADVERGAPLKQIVALGFHTLDAYGFHALQGTEALAERRQGGETGVVAVRCLSGVQVWQAVDAGEVDGELLDRALAALPRTLNGVRPIRDAAVDPTLFVLEHADGLRVNVLTLNGVVGEWSVAWRYADGRAAATHIWDQQARPLMHFTYLLDGVERMMLTGQPSWPVERTLLTSGALDALLRSKAAGGKRLETPELKFAYTCEWEWRQPPEPPPGRPLDQQ